MGYSGNIINNEVNPILLPISAKHNHCLNPNSIHVASLCKNMVRAPLRGRVFQHMDIFLFNDVPRSRHNESGFSQISIFCGCVKSHGRVWKNESRCDFNGFCGTKAIMLEKTAVRFFFCSVAYIYISLEVQHQLLTWC